jgi:hypothetical protein
MTILYGTRPLILALALVLMIAATACDTTAPAPPTATLELSTPAETPTALPVPTGTPIDVASVTAPPTPNDNENAPSPTPVTATSTGEAVTALQALSTLKGKALTWQKDARFGLLSNVRPGQQKNLLGGTLGDSNVNEPTPGGKGRNWTLIAFSPSSQGAMAISMDGTQVDLVKEGTVSGEVVQRFAGSNLSVLALASLDPSHLVDSDKIVEKAGDRGRAEGIGVALLAPDGLGLGPLPTPQAGGTSPTLAYELFGSDPSQQVFIFFDAASGQIVLDSAGP